MFGCDTNEILWVFLILKQRRWLMNVSSACNCHIQHEAEHRSPCTAYG